MSAFRAVREKPRRNAIMNRLAVARDGSAAHRPARRANALVLLDRGMSCSDVAKVLLLGDDTIRTGHRLYEEDGFEGLASFGYDGSACRLGNEQQGQLKAWVTETLPRTIYAVGAWIEKKHGIDHERPIRPSRAAASAGHGASQTQGGLKQAGPSEAGRLYPASTRPC
jgi:transposase